MMKIVKESILNEQRSKLALAAGLVILQDKKILLVHPTGAPWNRSYSIPKGHVEAGESILDAAKRETREEIGINTDNLEILNTDTDKFIDYTDKKGKVYKRVYYFVATPIRPIKGFKLQKAEVDWAGFLPEDKAKSKIFPRFKKFLNLI